MDTVEKMPMTSHVVVHKNDVHDAKIGDSHMLMVKGKIKSISVHHSNPDMRSVEMDHEVDHKGQPKEESLDAMREKMVAKHGTAEYK